MFYLYRLFYSFLPLHNPIGFGAADFIELSLTLLLVWAALAWQTSAERVGRLASRTAWCIALLAALPVVLRLLLLRTSPVPSALGADDFSTLLLADTLAHFRLTNPTHALHQFFETAFVLQEPTYSSIYPVGQGLMLALGRLIFGHPWAGVALSAAAMSSLCYWMLRAWTKPTWALLGGLLAALQFGPLSHWMNTYWGGALAAAAGCLVFGSLPRLRDRWRGRDAALLGTGLGIHLLTRPFESIFLALSVIVFFAPVVVTRNQIRPLMRAMLVAGLPIICAFGLILLHDKRVTGSWMTLPYALSRFQYGVPSAFTVQPNPIPHRQLTKEQQIAYEVQSSVHGGGTDTARSFLERLPARVRFYRFFFLPPLYLALPAFLWSLREARFRFVFFTILLFFVGSNVYPYFYAHYVAGITCLFMLVTVTGLENLSRVSPDAVRVILFLCGAHFVFWYGVHLSLPNPERQGVGVASELTRYETWDEVNHGDPDGRILISSQLAHLPGQQLVFVRYWPQHTVTEWVYNAADVDRAQVVWARDLGPMENEKLRNYYPGRTAWLLEPDAHPPKLSPYLQTESHPAPAEPTRQESVAPKPVPGGRPKLKFEEVK
jgi:hypothetical protein